MPPPPKSPVGKPKQKKQVNSTSGFPDLKPKKPDDGPSKSIYEEIQEDELIALAAIYGDDFYRIETSPLAWKVGVFL